MRLLRRRPSRSRARWTPEVKHSNVTAYVGRCELQGVNNFDGAHLFSMHPSRRVHRHRRQYGPHRTGIPAPALRQRREGQVRGVLPRVPPLPQDRAAWPASAGLTLPRAGTCAACDARLRRRRGAESDPTATWLLPPRALTFINRARLSCVLRVRPRTADGVRRAECHIGHAKNKACAPSRRAPRASASSARRLCSMVGHMRGRRRGPPNAVATGHGWSGGTVVRELAGDERDGSLDRVARRAIRGARAASNHRGRAAATPHRVLRDAPLAQGQDAHQAGRPVANGDGARRAAFRDDAAWLASGRARAGGVRQRQAEVLLRHADATRPLRSLYALVGSLIGWRVGWRVVGHDTAGGASSAMAGYIVLADFNAPVRHLDDRVGSRCRGPAESIVAPVACDGVRSLMLAHGFTVRVSTSGVRPPHSLSCFNNFGGRPAPPMTHWTSTTDPAFAYVRGFSALSLSRASL